MKTQQKRISQFITGENLAYEGSIVEVTEKGTHKGVGFIKGHAVVDGMSKMFYWEFTGGCNKLFEEIISE